ncbi:MAG: Isoleucine-tRNA ligase, partial [Candidatus Nomurabacteria bacterium GW2011_GWA1_37_20]
NLDNYKFLEPTRALRNFIGNFSTWYLRRSRERIKNGDEEARQTLYFVLKNLAKLMAPFAPFAAEDIWLKLKTNDDKESVHLAKWSASQTKWFSFGKKNVMKEMQIVRDIVTLGLEARQNAGIKVRQPLAKLEIKNYKLGGKYLELIKDELNVKEVIQNKNIENQVKLDVNITSELKQEGDYRELAHALQDMRKKLGLTPSNIISIVFETDETGKELIQKFETDMKKTVLVSRVEFRKNDGPASAKNSSETMQEIKIDDLFFKIKIKK